MNPLQVMDQEETFFSGNAFNIRSLSKAYGIQKVEMSRLLKCKRQQVNTIFSKNEYIPRSKDIYQKLLELVKIYSILRMLLKAPKNETGSMRLEEKIFRWFRIPNPAYPDAMSPFDMVAEGKGIVVIRSLMDQLHGTPA